MRLYNVWAQKRAENSALTMMLDAKLIGYLRKRSASSAAIQPVPAEVIA